MKKLYTDVEEIWRLKSSSSPVYADQSRFGIAQTYLRRVYLALALMLWLSVLHAQHPIGLIFSISAEEAKQLYKQDDEPIPDSYFHTLVDSFGIEGYTPSGTQKNGHYLYVKARGERLSVELNSIHSHQVLSLHNERDLLLRVLDDSGKAIQNATIKLGQEKVPYNLSLNCYPIKRRNRGGFLEVQLATDTLFYEVEAGGEGSIISKRYRQFTQTQFGYYLTTPIRWATQLYRYFKRLIKWGYWNPRWRFFPRDSRSLHGYVVTHLPKYQPGDTLKLKAFVASPQGRPLQREVKLKVRNYRQPKAILDTLLKPTTAGAFIVNWAIPDSVELDREYRINITHPRRRKLGGLHHSFRYEAYQLDEVVYNLHVPQDTFHQGESYVLTPSAKDQNDLPVYDTQVKMHFLANRLLSFHADEVMVPDTLWTLETDLSTQGTAEIAIPDSIFPAARMKVQVSATFRNSNGELQEKKTSFHYSPLQEEIQVHLERGRLKATYFRNQKEENTPALLIQSRASDYQLDSSLVELPLNIPLAPRIGNYRIYAQGAMKDVQLSNTARGFNSKVDFQTRQDGDTLRLSLTNPHKLPVNWIIRHYGGTLMEGATRDSHWTRQLAARKANTYYLKYQYQWGGRVYQEEQEIIRYRKLLKVRVEQPTQVVPGQRAEVKVSVKDFKGRPVQGVNLAAGAINAQFGAIRNFQPASITYRKGVPPLVYNELHSSLADGTWSLPIKQQWYQDLQLERSHYYRLRFPKDGVYFQSDTLKQDSFYQKTAQFAPFLVKNGKSVPIYLIYCNRRLVYYYDISQQPPYSFQGVEGLNRITLRTREEEITIDSVVLKKGHKLEFSIDLLHLSRWDKKHRIKREKMPSTFTQEEKKLIKSSLLVLRNPKSRSILVWDGAFHIHHYERQQYYNNNSDVLLGPFLKGSRLYYKEANGLTSDFLFEPGFSYSISKNRERLYEYDLFSKKRKDMSLPNQLEDKPIGQWVYSASVLEDQKQKIERKGLRRNWYKEAPKGNYQFTYANQDAPLRATVLQKEDTTIAIYSPSQRLLRSIPQGTYRLTLIREDWSLHQRTIDVKGNSLLFQRLSEAEFTPDTANWLSKTEIGFSSTPPTTIPGRNPNPWAYSDNPYFISGYVKDETGEPLIGASILVKGTSQGTVTDLDGRYELYVSDPGAVLLISYTGFQTHELRARGAYSNAELSAAGMRLDEVVVTGYGGTQSRRPKLAATGILTERVLDQHSEIVTDLLQGRISSVQLTETGSNIMVRGASTGRVGGPLFLIDGKMADPSKLLPSQIRNITELRPEEATAIYGSKARNGAILITTNLRPDLAFFNTDHASSLRSEFKDYAYWQPNIITDKNGAAVFSVSFPDNITAWKAYALAMDKKRRSGIGFAETRAFKPVIAQLAVPRFLIEGDEAAIIGKSSNYTPDSIQIKTRFLSSDSLLSQQESWLSAGKVESTDIRAVMAGDSLAITYSLSAKEGTYVDGETRKLPVLKKGTEETLGEFHILEQDTQLSLSFQQQTAKIELYMEQDLLPLLLREIDYLKNYKYGCNEQTASKLMALCLEQSLRDQLGEVFTDENQIRKCIHLLEKNQNEEGEWGWWRRSKGRNWVTRHVIKALLLAQEMGYETKSLDMALRAVTQQFQTLPPRAIIPSLSILAQAGQNFAYEETLAVLDTQILNLAAQFEIIKIKQLRGLPYQLDSLYHHRKTTLLGSHYWGSPTYGFPGHDIKLSLLAHAILMAADKVDEAHKVKTYFLENRKHTGQRHSWRNTLETALILESILPGLLPGGPDLKEKTIVQLEGLAATKIDSFPAHLQLPLAEERLGVKKKGSSTIYLTAYQIFWNERPEKVDSIFKISTYIRQEEKTVQQIAKGHPVQLVVELESNTRASYLMLEVPIPGACSYYRKPNGSRGVEVHREYDIHQTSIFIEDLSPGKHQFIIELEPRFSGKFVLNPAKIEQMYFPTFYGREGMKQIEVVKD